MTTGIISDRPFHLNWLHATYLAIFLMPMFFMSLPASARAQVSGNTLFGDVKVDESEADGAAPLTLTIVLYDLGGNVKGRQTVATGGRYRFTNIRPGEYDLAVEVATSEIARVHISLGGTPGSDFRQDLEFAWKRPAGESRFKAATVSAADAYKRSDAGSALFEKGQAALDNKKYDQAVGFFKQVIEKDNQDFQAWTELGTALLLEEKKDEAEQAYLQAIEVRPNFVLALLNLGRLRTVDKKFEAAIDPLTKALELQPDSAEANYLLGESYLQLKKGSKAVGYLTEAARLGKIEAHLRLAALYNAVGMKDKAAAEYEAFLKKQPNYPDRKKLEQYITENKKN